MGGVRGRLIAGSEPYEDWTGSLEPPRARVQYRWVSYRTPQRLVKVTSAVMQPEVLVH